MKHEDLYARAQKVIPGGVNSPVRAFTNVGGTPIFVERGEGQYIYTADGRRLTDYCCSWGAMILGHAHPEVAAAMNAAIAGGNTFGIATRREVEFAERLSALVPSMDMLRVVNSGTEAVMTAIRIARGATGRNIIVKFDGSYHGHSDAVLVKSGSGVLTIGKSSSAGVPPGAVADTIVVPYNDLNALKKAFEAHPDEIAAVLVEPVAGNMGLVLPIAGYMRSIRQITNKYQSLMICDEVITGFRYGFSSFSTSMGRVKPDLITLGKIIGGGLPLAVVGGKAKLMQTLAPLGDVYQAGTLSGNPVAVAAGLKTIEVIEHTMPYARIQKLCNFLALKANMIASGHHVPITFQHLGGVFTPFCRKKIPTNLAEVKECDTALYAKLFHGMLKHNIYLSPSQFECNFVSAAHTEKDITLFLEAFTKVCMDLEMGL